MNMQLDTAPYNTSAGAIKPIKDIKLPVQVTGAAAEVGLVINIDNVQFDDGSVSGGYAEFVGEREAPAP